MNNNILINEMNNYLESSNKSLRFLSYRTGVTSSYLCQIKNGKKKTSIDIGLRILKACKSKLEIKKEWIEQELKASGAEYNKLHEDAITETKIKELQSEAGSYLCAKKRHMDIYLDIVSAEGKGLSQGEVLRKYGQEGVRIAISLRERGLILYENLRFLDSIDCDTVKIKSYDSMKFTNEIFSVAKIEEKDKQDKFKLNFFYQEISSKKKDSLKKMYDEFRKNVLAVYLDDDNEDCLGKEKVFFQLSFFES